jgi:hypothetical protein
VTREKTLQLREGAGEFLLSADNHDEQASLLNSPAQLTSASTLHLAGD